MSCHRCRKLGHLVADCPNPCARCKRAPGACRGGKDCETYLKRSAEQARLEATAGSILGEVMSRTAARRERKRQKMADQNVARLIALINNRKVKTAAANSGTVVNDPQSQPGPSTQQAQQARAAPTGAGTATETEPQTQSTFIESPSIGNRVGGRRGRGTIDRLFQ